jgi:hypothetical protein
MLANLEQRPSSPILTWISILKQCTLGGRSRYWRTRAAGGLVVYSVIERKRCTSDSHSRQRYRERFLHKVKSFCASESQKWRLISCCAVR